MSKYPNFIGKLVDEKIVELEKNKETEANKLYAELNSEAAKEAWIEDFAAIYNTSYEIYVEQCIEKSNNAFDKICCLHKCIDRRSKIRIGKCKDCI